jgi:hypothetical protein
LLRQDSQVREDRGDAPRIGQIPEQRQTFEAQVQCSVPVALIPSHPGEIVEQERHVPAVPLRSMDGEALLVECARAHQVAAIFRQHAEAVECRSAASSVAHRAVECEALLVQCRRPLIVLLIVGNVAEVLQCQRDAVAVAHASVERQTLLVPRAGTRVVALQPGEPTGDVQGLGAYGIGSWGIRSKRTVQPSLPFLQMPAHFEVAPQRRA